MDGLKFRALNRLYYSDLNAKKKKDHWLGLVESRANAYKYLELKGFCKQVKWLGVKGYVITPQGKAKYEELCNSVFDYYEYVDKYDGWKESIMGSSDC